MNWGNVTSLVILLLSLLFGSQWGMIQGMIMIQPHDKRAVKRWADEYVPDGVRNHKWFPAYHRMCFYTGLVLATLAVFWWTNIPWGLWGSPGSRAVILRYAAFSLGCALLSWECSELMYAYSRYGRWIARERVHLIDIVSIYPSVLWTLILHGIRTPLGVIMVMIHW